MKKVVMIIAAIFVAITAFAQTKEDMEASAARIKKLQELCDKMPANTNVPEVDNYAQALLNASLAAVENSVRLEHLYYRSIGETKDGVTDVTIVKPSLEDLLALSASIAAEAASVAAAVKLADASVKKVKEIRNPLQVAKVALMAKFTVDVAPLLAEESAAQVKAIANMIETAKSGTNL